MNQAIGVELSDNSGFAVLMRRGSPGGASRHAARWNARP
jgi:hypothetical protein